MKPTLAKCSRLQKNRFGTMNLAPNGAVFDNRLSVNVSAFYMDWKNLQIPSVEVLIYQDEEGNSSIVNNFRIDNSEAKSVGFELEAQALPMNNFLIGGGVGYLDAGI